MVEYSPGMIPGRWAYLAWPGPTRPGDVIDINKRGVYDI